MNVTVVMGHTISVQNEGAEGINSGKYENDRKLSIYSSYIIYTIDYMIFNIEAS